MLKKIKGRGPIKNKIKTYLVGTLLRYTNVRGLGLGEDSQFGAELGQVQAGDFLVKLLGQSVHANLYFFFQEKKLRQLNFLKNIKVKNIVGYNTY